MKCPKCGKEILEGHLYCEDCGFEIKLVPEFETQVEQSMTESIQTIAEEVALDQKEIKTEIQKKTKKANRSKSGNLLFIVGLLLSVVVFILTALYSGGKTIWSNSTFIQEKIVNYYLEQEDFPSAVAYMERVIEKAPDNVLYRFQLGEIYMQQGEVEQTLELYKTIAANPVYTIDEQITAVEYIIEYYAALKDYEAIAQYLETIQNEEIQMAFLEYMSGTVSFNQPEGTYAAMITLKLSGDGIGTIYYTMDGTIPDEKSQVYQNTIFLEPGENVVSAVFINDYGVKSPVVTKCYQIESKKTSPPEVLTYSGHYTAPVSIQVASSAEGTIYYTTDGTTPNRNSKRYYGSFWAGEGKTIYKFVAIGANGEASEVVTRTIELTLASEFTTKQAAECIVAEQVETYQAVSDGSGHIIQDDTHLLLYEYLYPMTVEAGKDCYYFAEVCRNTETGEQARTGRYFGVNITNGEVYSLNG